MAASLRVPDLRFRGATTTAIACLALGAAFSSGACSSDGAATARAIDVAPSLTFPRSLLDGVSTLTVKVYAPPAACDDDGTASDTSGKALATLDLGTSCSGSTKFCGTLTLDQSNDPRIFVAVGDDATGTEIAVGCTKTVVDEAALPVALAMKPYVAPADCGDGVVETTEECDPPGSSSDPVCDASCHTKEELLSRGQGSDPSEGTVTGTTGQKTSPAIVWPSGDDAAGRFFATYADASDGTNSELDVRILGAALAPDASQAAATYFPTDASASGTGGGSPAPISATYVHPSVALAGGMYEVAYENDGAASGSAIEMRILDSDLDVASGATGPITIASSGQTPSVAANGNSDLFVAWGQGGGVSGQICLQKDLPGACDGNAVVSFGSGSNPVVAGVGDEWLVVWEGAGITGQFVGQDGTPLGSSFAISGASFSGAQTSPRVAVLSDGRFAVAWIDGGSGNVFVQRFGKNQSPIAGDQSAPVNDLLKGKASGPSIAAGNGAFVVAWVDGASGDVRARYLGGSSDFLANPVDGQFDEFLASVATGRTRAHTATAIGGAGPYVAIAWEDTSTGGTPGIYARRLPPPASP